MHIRPFIFAFLALFLAHASIERAAFCDVTPPPNVADLVYQLIAAHCGNDGCTPQEIAEALEEASNLFPLLSIERLVIDFINNKALCIACPSKIEALSKIIELAAQKFCGGQNGVSVDGNLSPQEVACLVEHSDDIHGSDEILVLFDQIAPLLSPEELQAIKDVFFWSITSILAQCGYVFPLPPTEEQKECISDKIMEMVDKVSDSVRVILESILQKWLSHTPSPSVSPSPETTPPPPTPAPVTPIPTHVPMVTPRPGGPIGLPPRPIT